MNKDCYRLIFSKAHGMLIAVAEFVVSKNKSSGRKSRRRKLPRPVESQGFFAWLGALGIGVRITVGILLCPMIVFAQIVADPSAPTRQQPTVLTAANGVPVVNIQTPSSAGVSRNTYTRFDVDSQGAVLNNSRTNVQTRLGGWVQGNPWLARGPARVILNEVNSSDPSQLRGYIEVGGSRAEVVIANPAGINVDGAGFINASRATLTTGTPIVNSGSLEAYRVQSGTIHIAGAGLDTSTADYTELIARAVAVNAGLWANTLGVTTGANQVDSADSAAAPIPGTGAPPAYAIDVALLGGMYAGKITLVGTEAGLGVRNAGEIGAGAGDVVVTSAGRLENTGRITSASGATITTKGSIANAGTLYTGGNAALQSSEQIENSGVIAAKGDTTLAAADQISNNAGAVIGAGVNTDGTIGTVGTLKITAGQSIISQGQTLSGGELSLEAKAIDNQAAATISAGKLLLQAGADLTNRGLIDGGETLLTAATLNNLGTGRIYGDHLALAATTLNNLPENGAAPALAARDRLDIGAGIINNREHALIFSAGDMAIGGALDANRRATGQGATLNNNSATIEALGSMCLSVRNINNTNEHFSTKIETVSVEPVVEYQGGGSPNRYREGTPDVYTFDNEALCLHTPDGYYGENWSHYDYDRTTSETKVATSDPAQILAGGNMAITADILLNDKSRIVAGGALTGDLGTLTNTEVAGERVITDLGTQTSVWRKHRKGRDGTGSSTTGYAPAPIIQAITLTPTVYQQNTTPTGSGAQIAAHSGDLNSAIPTSSLYALRPDPTAGCLIETDPRFADYRTWLGSDYMLNALSFDPAYTMKRLGDGFYEQRLVREQVASLTGMRFLEGYANDEEQYRALMDNGITYAGQHNLRPGVALSAGQMAGLTSDMVWLVEKEVTLPDGSKSKVLAPQVYVRLREGDLLPSGALLAGQNIHLATRGDVVNSGTIAGRELVALNAGNIKNLGGRISGADLGIAAGLDLNNTGGTIQGQNSLTAVAGRDINVGSATSSQTGSQGERTNISRLAGLYVTNPDGLLVAGAGRNVNLNAARVSSGGTAQITAGNNLNLGVVSEDYSNRVQWNRNNWRADSSRTDRGSSIQAQGAVTLQAGNDLNARAAQVTSDRGAVAAGAGHDVNLTTGEANVTLDEAHKVKTKGFLSSKTVTRRDTLDATKTIAITLSGETTTLAVGNDLNVSGSNVVSTTDTGLYAGNDIKVTAAGNSEKSSHFQKTKKSGLFGTGGIGFTIGTQQQSSDAKDTTTSAAGSTVASLNGDVTIQAGKKYRQTGSDVVALGQKADGSYGTVEITAKSVVIDEARETYVGRVEQKSKSSGLTVAFSNPVVSTVQSAADTAGAVKGAVQTGDGRMQALAAATAGLAAKNLYDAGSQLAQNPSAAASVGVSITYGESKSRTTTSNTGTSGKGSQVLAGGDVNIRATGAGTDSDLTIQGSRVAAGNNLQLKADDQLNLLAAKNDSSLRSKNSSSSWGAGVLIAKLP